MLPRHVATSKNLLLLFGLLIASLMVLGLDYITPLGIAGGLPYILCMVACLWIEYRHIEYFIALLCVFLTIIVYFLTGDDSTNIYAIVNRAYAILFLLLTAFFITSYKNARKKEQELLHNISIIIHNHPIATLMIDSNLNILLSNALSRDLLNITNNETEAPLTSVSPKTSQAAQKLIKKISSITAQEKARCNLTLLKNTKERRYLECSLVRLPSSNQNHFLLILNDVTKHKQALVQSQRAQKKLERSAKALEEFAYRACHDLREPLRGIYSYTNFLIEDHQDTINADAIIMLKKIPLLSKRLENSLDSLIKFSNYGQQLPLRKKVDVNRVLKTAQHHLSFSLCLKNASIHIDSALSTMYCDEHSLYEILYQLLSNAVIYNTSASPQIHIGREGTHQEIYIRDNGIGIEKSHMNNIFRIFKRLNARHLFHDGLGMGLSLAQRIVENHNGLIRVDSTPNEGTTVYFTLESMESL